MKVAVIGAGKMGTQVAGQLPGDLKKIIIDSDGTKAAAVAEKVGADFATDLSAAGNSDVIAVVVPAFAVDSVMEQLSGVAKDGAVIMNMATTAQLDQKLLADNPRLHFVDCKIIGNAGAMSYGAPCYVIAGTEDKQVFAKIATALSGYTKVLMGDPAIVPKINTLGSEEGIRCGVRLRKRLREFDIPKEWEDVVLYSVAAGTLQAFASGQMGHFALELAEKIEKEDL